MGRSHVSENKESLQSIDSNEPTMLLNIIVAHLYHQERDNQILHNLNPMLANNMSSSKSEDGQADYTK